MADVTGPVSTLPGYTAMPPDKAMCDEHLDVPAVRRIQGETDSFGAEFHDVCQKCLDGIREYLKTDSSGVCDWCSMGADDLRYRRDFEEGLYGRVYRVCGACVRKESDSLADDQ